METLLNANSAVIIPLVIALTGIVKTQEWLDKKRMSLVALGFGILLTALFALAFQTHEILFMVILMGSVNGAAAVGIYEAGKNTGINDKVMDGINKLKN